jgi:hypothetical protein
MGLRLDKNPSLLILHQIATDGDDRYQNEETGGCDQGPGHVSPPLDRDVLKFLSVIVPLGKQSLPDKTHPHLRPCSAWRHLSA